MNIEERFYSTEEISNGRDRDDRLYSESEVEFISDLFSEFYQLHSDHYEDDVEKAYSDFYDAYSSGPILTEYVHKAKDRVVSGDPKLVRGAAAVAGGALGLGASKLINSKNLAKKKALTKKINSGMASRQDLKELDKLNRKIKLNAAASTVVGAGAGYGATVLASNYAKSRRNGRS